MSLHAQQSPEAQAALAAQKRNSTISALIISLLTFGLVILVLMVIALTVNSKSPPEIISYAAGVEEAEEIEKPEMTNEVERKPSAPSSSLAKVIAANTTSPTAMPVPDIEVTEPSLDFGNGDDFGEGWGDSEDWGNGSGAGGTFFGRNISGTLGVVLDISRSTHSTLKQVIDELEQNFKSAPIICVRFACFRVFDSELISYKKAAKMNLLRGIWGKANKEEIINIQKTLEGRSSVFATTRKGGLSNLTSGVEALIEMDGITDIYLFSDFADGFSQEVMDELVGKLKKAKVKLSVIYVSGQIKMPTLTEMCEKTGGTATQFQDLIPKK